MGHRKPPKSSLASVATSSQSKERRDNRWRLSHLLSGAWVVLAAMATSANLGLVEIIELETQSLFFEIRGSTEPPKDIVILAIDEQSLSVPIQYYQTNPQQYSYLKPLQAWPWERRAYGQVIDKLMKAGVKSVALDIVFASPSSYGSSDDRALAEVLQRYPGRVTLAAEYEQLTQRVGSLVQLTQPQPLFRTQPMSVGYANFPVEADGRIRKFASEFTQLLADQDLEQFENFYALTVTIPSFEKAVVAASLERSGEAGESGRVGEWGNLSNSPPPLPAPSPLPLASSKGDYIYFYGPAGTFEQIPFWHVLDPENWNTYLQQGKYFKDKIVLVGASAAALQDLHKAPFSQSWLYSQKMAGVEIQANAIATLLQRRAIKQAIPHPQIRGLFILIFVTGAAVCLTRFKHPLAEYSWIGFAIGYGSISYALFTYYFLILPTAVPMIAIALCGTTYQITKANRERKIQPGRTIDDNSSPSEIPLASQPKLQAQPEQELTTIGKILSGRYKIVKVLGCGGFGETYVAEDKLRPGNPLCVVKQLKLVNNHPKQLQIARRLFQLEAETLEKLGKHDQIPQLLAYFEQDEEFYLVQEYIVGHPLSWELRPSNPISEAEAIEILRDLLQILQFVHNHNVIHRDIKPSNIMRRHLDRKLILIDFGAVKQVSTQLLEPGEKTNLTVSIGTQGYAPSEQSAGRAFFSSDIYAVGMTVIKALTGLSPQEIQLDATTGELLWTQTIQISPQLTEILSTMVLTDYRQRYGSASIALNALTKFISTTSLSGNLFANNELTEDLDNPTAVWETDATKIPDSATNLLPPSS